MTSLFTGLWGRTSGLRLLAGVYAGAVTAGYLASRAQVPLPWMIGPLLTAMLVSVSGARVEVPLVTRPLGQLVVGATVGAFMTPAALHVLADQFALMFAAIVMTVVAAVISALLLMRLSGLDAISANLASIPCGPVEMAALAERYRVDPGPVAFAQLLRIVLLVLVVPPVLGMLGDRATPFVGGAGESLDPGATLLILAASFAGGVLFKFLRVTSPFFLGPLAGMAIVASIEPTTWLLPGWMIASSQVLLGVWLGCTFNRTLISRAGRVLPATFASTALLLVLCAAMAIAFAALSGVRWKTMVLATAPGSITEMALTAKVLGEGVALVTAFHVTRIFVTLPLMPVLFRFAIWLLQAKRSRPGGDTD